MSLKDSFIQFFLITEKTMKALLCLSSSLNKDSFSEY